MAKSRKTSGSGRGAATTRKTSKSASRSVQTARKAKPASRPKARKPAKAPRKAAGKTTPKKTAKKSLLTRQDIRHFRDLLLEKRRTLTADMSGMEANTGPRSGGNLSSMPTHMADMGTDNFEHEFTLGLLESEQALLKEIDEALQRIEGGTYGICLGTGEAIPKVRLRAKPWAKYTVEFSRKLEQGLVRPPDREVVSDEEEEPDVEAGETEFEDEDG